MARREIRDSVHVCPSCGKQLKQVWVEEVIALGYDPEWELRGNPYCTAGCKFTMSLGGPV